MVGPCLEFLCPLGAFLRFKRSGAVSKRFFSCMSAWLRLGRGARGSAWPGIGRCIERRAQKAPKVTPVQIRIPHLIFRVRRAVWLLRDSRCSERLENNPAGY